MTGEIRPGTGAQGDVIEDGATWTMKVDLGAPGVYELDKQPTPDEVIAMKAEFNRFGIDNAVPEVCARIVLDMLVTIDTDSRFFKASNTIPAGIVDAEGAPVYFSGYDTVFDLTKQASYVAGHWAQSLTQACALPGDQWPEGMTPPATFTEVLKKVKVEEIMNLSKSLTNRWGAKGDHVGTFTVDEATALELESKDLEAGPPYLCRAVLVRANEQDECYELEQFTVNLDNSVLRDTQVGRLVDGFRVPDEGGNSKAMCAPNLVELIDIVNQLNIASWSTYPTLGEKNTEEV